MLFKNKKTGALIDAHVDAHDVQFTSQGGGAIKSMSFVDFTSQYEPASVPEFQACTVGADWWEDGFTVPCFSNGLTWNGFGQPYFEKQTLLDLIAAGRLDGVVYDETIDAFIDKSDEDDPVLNAMEITVAGSQVRTVYPVGTGYWCWDKCVPVLVKASD